MTQVDQNSFFTALIAAGINYAGSMPELATIDQAHDYVKVACLNAVRSGEKTAAEASGIYEGFLSKFMLGEHDLEKSVGFLRGCADASARRIYDGSDASVQEMNVHAENEFERPLRGILTKHVADGYLEVREAVKEYERFTVDYLGVTPIVDNLIECLTDCVHAGAKHDFAGTDTPESEISRAMKEEFESNVAELGRDQKISPLKAIRCAGVFAEELGMEDSWTEMATARAAKKQAKVERHNAENPDAPKVADSGATQWLKSIKSEEPSRDGRIIE